MIHIVSSERKHILSYFFLGVLATCEEGGKLCGGHGRQTGPQEPDFPCLSVFVGGNEDSFFTFALAATGAMILNNSSLECSNSICTATDRFWCV